MSLHPSFAVTPAREPLGVLDAWMWARAPKAADGTRPGVKESLRWMEGYARVAELPEARFVYVADREADIRELMPRAWELGTPADWLLRSKHNRALPGGRRSWTQVLASAVLGEIRSTLPGGRGCTAREVRQAVYAQRVALSDRRRGHFEVTCLIACEIAAPPGAKPIEWRLLTNRTAESLEAAAELIDCYHCNRARWEIELLFLVLKEGCRVEALQLATMQRIERALALFLAVAWRIAQLMRLGRAVPDRDAVRSSPRSGRPFTSSPRNPSPQRPAAQRGSAPDRPTGRLPGT